MVEGAVSCLYEQLLELVPADLRNQFGEVLYSGRSAFEQPSPLYLLGFNPGGDPANEALARYTIGNDLHASRGPERQHWSAFEDDWRVFGPGALRYQRGVLHLLNRCSITSPATVPASNVLFVRSTAIATLDAADTARLKRDCWALHDRVITGLRVEVVVCFGQDAGEWVRDRLGAGGPAIDTFVEANQRRWSSTTHAGRNGSQVVTLTHPSRASWLNSLSDPTELVARALARATK